MGRGADRKREGMRGEQKGETGWYVKEISYSNKN